MKTLIFHGSEITITKPSLEFSKRNNDYGVGFYCSDELELAKEWACRYGNDGFANAYNLNTEGLAVLDISSDEENTLQWIAILLQNRLFKMDNMYIENAKRYVIEKFAPDITSYDVIKGYRADDSYFQYAEAFIENRIPLRILSKALKLGLLGMQTVLATERSLEHLTYVGTEEVLKSEYYPRFLHRDNKARKDYRKLLNSFDLKKSDVFLYDIIREEMKEDDPRIQRSLLK